MMEVTGSLARRIRIPGFDSCFLNQVYSPIGQEGHLMVIEKPSTSWGTRHLITSISYLDVYIILSQENCMLQEVGFISLP